MDADPGARSLATGSICGVLVPHTPLEQYLVHPYRPGTFAIATGKNLQSRDNEDKCHQSGKKGTLSAWKRLLPEKFREKPKEPHDRIPDTDQNTGPATDPWAWDVSAISKTTPIVSGTGGNHNSQLSQRYDNVEDPFEYERLLEALDDRSRDAEKEGDQAYPARQRACTTGAPALSRKPRTTRTGRHSVPKSGLAGLRTVTGTNVTTLRALFEEGETGSGLHNPNPVCTSRKF